MKNRIYLDYAATSPVLPEVLAEMLPYFNGKFGNPSGVYGTAREARQAVEQARRQVAEAIGAEPGEIYFTSGGSESDNMAIQGIARAASGRGRHIITSRIEHHAVLNPCRQLEREGWQVTYLPVDRFGRVSPEDVEKAVTPDTALISIMSANNEIGTLEPVGEIGRIAGAHGIPFHTDAVQAVGCTDVDVRRDNIDLLSLSAHKIYGPKGTGALYIRRGTRIESLIRGGAQERGLRAGTENTAGIVGLGAAIRIAKADMAVRTEAIRHLRDRMIRTTLETIPGSCLNGPAEERLCNNCHFSFDGVESETLLLRMDLAGVAASGGSACTSGSTEPSHVLEAIRPGSEKTGGSIRLTLGRETTEADVDEAVRIMREIVTDLRNLRSVLLK
ncbi:MAG: aminotransferase class V-fold PLP-dependent enzyme [Clostridia bacterium]|nr:aminotransferase class V-fold PLP-dependent enzyme [Clostridia bacterium]